MSIGATVPGSIPVPISVGGAIGIVPRPVLAISGLGVGAEQGRFRAGPQPLKCAPVHSLWFLGERRKQVAAAA